MSFKEYFDGDGDCGVRKNSITLDQQENRLNPAIVDYGMPPRVPYPDTFFHDADGVYVDDVSRRENISLEDLTWYYYGDDEHDETLYDPNAFDGTDEEFEARVNPEGVAKDIQKRVKIFSSTREADKAEFTNLELSYFWHLDFIA